MLKLFIVVSCLFVYLFGLKTLATTANASKEKPAAVSASAPVIQQAAK